MNIERLIDTGGRLKWRVSTKVSRPRRNCCGAKGGDKDDTRKMLPQMVDQGEDVGGVKDSGK